MVSDASLLSLVSLLYIKDKQISPPLNNFLILPQNKVTVLSILAKGKWRFTLFDYISSKSCAWTSKWHFIVMNDRLIDNLRYCYVYYSNKTTMIMFVLCCEHWYINPRDWKEIWLLLLRRYSYKLLTISGGRTNYCNLICLFMPQ